MQCRTCGMRIHCRMHLLLPHTGRFSINKLHNGNRLCYMTSMGASGNTICGRFLRLQRELSVGVRRQCDQRLRNFCFRTRGARFLLGCSRPKPAYNGAQVLSVRHDGMSPDAALPGLAMTPALDELTAWMAARRR